MTLTPPLRAGMAGAATSARVAAAIAGLPPAATIRRRNVAAVQQPQPQQQQPQQQQLDVPVLDQGLFGVQPPRASSKAVTEAVTKAVTKAVPPAKAGAPSSSADLHPMLGPV